MARNQFAINNDSPSALLLNIEPEGAFFALAKGEGVVVTDAFTAAPVTIKFERSDKGEPILSVWPGDGAVKVEKDGMDVLELVQAQAKAPAELAG